jgi:hypothetical protein
MDSQDILQRKKNILEMARFKMQEIMDIIDKYLVMLIIIIKSVWMEFNKEDGNEKLKYLISIYEINLKAKKEIVYNLP